jgi:hypothetical protein
MPNTHGIGKLFVQRIELRKGTPLFHRACTIEIEHPFRTGHSGIIRLGKWGLVLGLWRGTILDEDEAMRAAVQAKEIDYLCDDGSLNGSFFGHG